VPELSARKHVEVILPVIQEALGDLSFSDIDLISVAKGPGLVGPLMIGINAAKALSWATGIPFIGVNHVEAHLYAAFMSHEEIPLPAIGAILSGGHTTLVLIKGVGEYETIGCTIDDAVGEAFDKAAKILGLPYPGGPEIEKLAREGHPDRFPLKAGRIKGRPLDFSFSGLKTGVLYAAKGKGANYKSPLIIREKDKADLAAAFQQAAFEDIVAKIRLAMEKYSCSSVIFGGGVTCNQALRSLFGKEAYWPSRGLSLDNAAMIAGLGYAKWEHSPVSDPLHLEVSLGIQI